MSNILLLISEDGPSKESHMKSHPSNSYEIIIKHSPIGDLRKKVI